MTAIDYKVKYGSERFYEVIKYIRQTYPEKKKISKMVNLAFFLTVVSCVMSKQLLFFDSWEWVYENTKQKKIK